MERIDCEVTVETPELPGAHVREPQILLFWTSPSVAIVTVYFMENIAYSIVDPHAIAVGPDISLRYSVRSLSGAVAAGVTLRKVVYRFRGLGQRKFSFTVKSVKYNKLLNPDAPGDDAL